MQLSNWLELAGDTARGIVQRALGMDQVVFVRVPGAPPTAHLQGVVLPLFSENLPLQLALLAERSDCATLARWFLGLPADENFGSDSDVLEPLKRRRLHLLPDSSTIYKTEAEQGKV